MDSMTQPTAAPLSVAAPRIEYRVRPSWREPPPDVLFALSFGDEGPRTGARAAHVPLPVLAGQGVVEAWQATGPVHAGESGTIRYACDPHFLAGIIEVEETAQGGVVEATAHAYREIARFTPASDHPHLLRTWNYFDAINEGSGDAERYRGFCTGRVAGLGDWRPQHPAATVIGRNDGRRVLQVYWRAGRNPGIALENPRQVSAFRYPRQYGETAPTFSRAMLVSPELLMISGTASIVGHASRHPGDVREQVREILNNLHTLLAQARAKSPALPAAFGAQTVVKAYVRRRADLSTVDALLRERLPDVSLLILQGDVCRSALLVELDCVHSAA